jgi:hypothetical protein
LGELGFGLGLGELGFGLGVGVKVGVGVVVAGVDDEALDEDEDVDVVAEVDAAGLDDELLLSDLRDVADGLADVSRDAEVLASAAARSWSAALVVAAERTVLFGMSGHAALITDWLLASAACNSANMLQPMNAKPVSAPSAAGLRIRALTCGSSCAFWLR